MFSVHRECVYRCVGCASEWQHGDSFRVYWNETGIAANEMHLGQAKGTLDEV